MKIYDCIIFNGENHILEIRLNELNNFVDHFVIIEFGETFTGIRKERSIKNELLKKFEKKIRYFFIDTRLSEIDPWKREGYQRNQLTKGIFDAKPDDIIMISDVDEIPNLKKLDFNNVGNQVFAFSLVHSMYKINLLRKVFWIGTKLCKKKNFKSPQWLRSLKVHKKYNFFRIDKFFSKTYYSNFKIIDNSGWHFGWLMQPDEIIKKVNSYSHTEHNTPLFNNEEYIKKCINNKINFLDKNDILEISNDMEKLPNFVKNNLKKFDKWIIKK
tara:strand:- start:142 stop:954 length:813 start_codon:yes stop_codon:yes gene_type:complete